MLRIEQCEPGRNEACVCGSGRKFKRCCMDDYRSDVWRHAFKQYNQGLYEDALISCRRYITWYILCHRAHTVPFLASGTSEALRMLHIDIDALGNLVDLLHLCYYRTGRTAEFPGVVDRLSTAISDARWDAKVRYFKALWFLLDRDDRESASKEISTINIDGCVDPDILMLYLDVYPKPLPFEQKISLLDRILQHAEKPSELLQYTCLKGISYCLISEFDEGCRIIASAIETYKSKEQQRGNAYGASFLAHALQSLGRFSNKDEPVREAADIYKSQLELCRERGYGPAYGAMLAKALGDCHNFLGEYDVAAGYYEESLKYEDSELTKVFLAEAYVSRGDVDVARDLLVKVDTSRLNDAGNYDCAVSWTMLAIRSQKPTDLELAKGLLKSARAHDPLFIHHRDLWLLTLLETRPKADEGLIRRLVRSLNKYIILNPNVFGVGVNINRIVEDMAPSATENTEKQIARSRTTPGTPGDVMPNSRPNK